MSKTIKLEDRVHRELEDIQLKKETFSQTVARLINLHHQFVKLFSSHATGHLGEEKPKE